MSWNNYIGVKPQDGWDQWSEENNPDPDPDPDEWSQENNYPDIGAEWHVQEGTEHADATQWMPQPEQAQMSSTQMQPEQDAMSQSWQPMEHPMPYPSPQWGYAVPTAAHHLGAAHYAQQAAYMPWLVPHPPMGVPPGFPAVQGIVPSAPAHPAQHEQDGKEPQSSESDEAGQDETANAGDQQDEEADQHAMAVYCKECQTWLNGPRQWEDHKIGKKHRKNVQKAKRGTASSTEVAQPEARQPAVDEEPKQKTAMWQWLEDGRVAKQAESNQLEGDGIQKEGRSARRRRHKQEKEAREAAEREAEEREVAERQAREANPMAGEEDDEGSQPRVVPARPEFEDTELQKDVDHALSAVTGIDSSQKVVPPRAEFVGKSTGNLPTLLEPEPDEGLQPRKSKVSEQHHFQVEMD